MILDRFGDSYYPTYRAQDNGRSWFLKRATSEDIQIERIAVYTAKLLGLGRYVLSTGVTTINSEPYLCMPWIDCKTINTVPYSRSLVRDIPDHELARILLWHYLIGDYDRWEPNVVMSDEGLKLIDFNWAFAQRACLSIGKDALGDRRWSTPRKRARHNIPQREIARVLRLSGLLAHTRNHHYTQARLSALRRLAQRERATMGDWQSIAEDYHAAA